MLIKYFSQVGEMWQIAPEIRGMVKFLPFNLLNDFSPLGRFDLVFCRNVLIYFDQATKIDVLNRIDKVIERDGFLALGGAETVVGLTHAFKPIADKRGLYAPNPGGYVACISSQQRGAAGAGRRADRQRAVTRDPDKIARQGLRLQHDLSDRAAQFDQVVRACRVGERKHGRDRRPDLAAGQQIDRGLPSPRGAAPACDRRCAW